MESVKQSHSGTLFTDSSSNPLPTNQESDDKNDPFGDLSKIQTTIGNHWKRFGVPTDKAIGKRNISPFISRQRDLSIYVKSINSNSRVIPEIPVKGVDYELRTDVDKKEFNYCFHCHANPIQTKRKIKLSSRRDRIREHHQKHYGIFYACRVSGCKSRFSYLGHAQKHVKEVHTSLKKVSVQAEDGMLFPPAGDVITNAQLDNSESKVF